MRTPSRTGTPRTAHDLARGVPDVALVRPRANTREGPTGGALAIRNPVRQISLGDMEQLPFPTQ